MTEQESAKVLALAKRKARHGHYDWLFWTDRDGISHCARKSVQSIKTALLATGTRKKWFLVQASSGVLHRGYWRLGITMLRNAKYGI